MNLIELLLTLQNQIRVYHWQTESFAEHTAFGDTYLALDALIDSFMEIYIGKYNRPKSKEKFTITLFDYSDSIVENFNAYLDVLSKDLPKKLSEDDTDLLNIRDEMIGLINKLKYLLTLK